MASAAAAKKKKAQAAEPVVCCAYCGMEGTAATLSRCGKCQVFADLRHFYHHRNHHRHRHLNHRHRRRRHLNHHQPVYYCRHRVTNSRNKQINVCQRGDWSRHKLDCVPVAEQGAIDPNEELLRAAAPDQFKVTESPINVPSRHAGAARAPDS